MSEAKGPVEDAPWPLALTGHVVQESDDESGDSPRIHGYDVHDDLARSFSFAEVVLTSLCGEAPSREAGRAFEAAMTFLAPVGIASAPAHAAMLAQLCGGRPSGVLGVACLALTEQGRALVDAHSGLLGWLGEGGELPVEAKAQSDAERAHVAKLRAAVGGFAVTGLDTDLSLDAARIAVLYACGLHTSGAIEAALLIARIACSAAEAFAVKPASFRDYPMNNPPYRYEVKR